MFFGFICQSFGQDNRTEIHQLIKLLKTDSLSNQVLKSFSSRILKNAEKQIKGAGAKEKLESYTNFINDKTNEASKILVDSNLVKIYNKQFTTNEIKEIIAFYETPTGKKLQSNSNEITKEVVNTIYIKQISDLEKKFRKELARLDGKIWGGAYKVKPEQIIVYNGDFSDTKKVIRIKNNRKTKETFVTYAVPIYENKFWIRFDKKTELIDEETNESYLVKRLDNDFVLNKTMIVFDQKNKMIEVTLVFPKLKKSVKQVTLVELISDDADLMSNNSGDEYTNLKIINVKDFL